MVWGEGVGVEGMEGWVWKGWGVGGKGLSVRFRGGGVGGGWLGGGWEGTCLTPHLCRPNSDLSHPHLGRPNIALSHPHLGRPNIDFSHPHLGRPNIALSHFGRPGTPRVLPTRVAQSPGSLVTSGGTRSSAPEGPPVKQWDASPQKGDRQPVPKENGIQMGSLGAASRPRREKPAHGKRLGETPLLVRGAPPARGAAPGAHATKAGAPVLGPAPVGSSVLCPPSKRTPVG